MLRKYRVLSFLGFVLAIAAAPALAVECTTVANNAINPCGFEDAGAVAAWGADGGVPSFAAGLGQNGGAMRGTSADFGGLHIFSVKSPCFPVSPGQSVPLLYAVALESGAAPSCTAGWQQYSNASCTTGAGGAIGTIPTVPTGSYSAVSDSRVVASGVAALSLTIDCRTNAGAFSVLVDNALAIAPRPQPASVSVPTTGETALLLLALAIATLAYVRLSRRRG